MTHRTTTQDIERQLHALEDSLKALDMMPQSETLRVRMGSKTYGQAFRLERHTAEGVHMNPPYGLPDYLGMTKAEAHATLYTINRTLWAVQHARRLEARRSSEAVA
jgi:hypothetical protein